VDDSIRFDGNPIAEAMEAFMKMRYIEAFAIVHTSLDFLMDQLFQCYELEKKIGITRKYAESAKFAEYDKSSFRKTLRKLRISSLINENEYDRIQAFDKAQKKIIHRIVLGIPILPVQLIEGNPGNVQITNTEAVFAFRDGIEIYNVLNSKFLHHRNYIENISDPKRNATRSFGNRFQR
jgi:hypothetical protein